MNITDVFSTMDSIFGTDGDTLSIFQILARCIVIYILGIALVRLGKKRFLGKIAAFDTILAIIIGSLLSRAITDPDYFLEILVACLLLIILHRVFSLLATYSEKFGNLIKGHDRVILQDGEVLWEAMKKSSLSEQDLMQSVRLNANTTELSKVKNARLERNGEISIVMKENDKSKTDSPKTIL